MYLRRHRIRGFGHIDVHAHGRGAQLLGVGVQPPTPEWGAIISGGRSRLFNAPWISIFPGIFLAVTGVGLSFWATVLQKFFRKGH